ncbi:alpha/beta hydrolase, partial [Burkholderia seminalis]
MNPIDTSSARPTGNHDGLGYLRHGAGPECVMVLHDWLGDHT